MPLNLLFVYTQSFYLMPLCLVWDRGGGVLMTFIFAWLVLILLLYPRGLIPICYVNHNTVSNFKLDVDIGSLWQMQVIT